MGEASIPSEVAEHIDFVAGLSEFFTDEKSKAEMYPHPQAKLTGPPQNDIIVTPSVLKNYYNIPLDMKVNNSGNYQGIAAFSDMFSVGALDVNFY